MKTLTKWIVGAYLLVLIISWVVEMRFFFSYPIQHSYVFGILFILAIALMQSANPGARLISGWLYGTGWTGMLAMTLWGIVMLVVEVFQSTHGYELLFIGGPLGTIAAITFVYLLYKHLPNFFALMFGSEGSFVTRISLGVLFVVCTFLVMFAYAAALGIDVFV